MPLDIIIGAQWGDEGKGRIVDLLAREADFVARFNGGDNAGHTVTAGSQTFKLHLIPSGIIHPHAVSAIGNGVVINPETLLHEMQTLSEAGISISPEGLKISYAAHLITPAHIALDKAQETARGQTKIGTTLRGIGPTYTDKTSRCGVRAGSMLNLRLFRDEVEALVNDINWRLTHLYGAEPLDASEVARQMGEYALQLAPYITDVSALLTDAMRNGKRVLGEGAQGTLLDLDHGTYPFVTSSTATAPGALTGLGLGVGCVEHVIGVTKAFQTRVGSGAFPTEVTGDTADRLRGTGANPWDEYGTTTGRPRRVGWLDMVLLRYAARINGLTELALTKLDILSGINPIKLCVGYCSDNNTSKTVYDLPLGPGDLGSCIPVYEEIAGWEGDLTACRTWESLPDGARAYINRVEEYSGLPARLISVGPERGQVIEIS